MRTWKHCLAGALTALAVAAPAAAAKPEKAKTQTNPATTPVAAAACEDRQFASVFASWNDRALYTLAPDGGFEAQASGWTLAGATIAAESSPFLLGASLGVSSLELPAGASALSPPICVQRGFPSFRFVARSADAGRLRVDVHYGSGAAPKRAGLFRPRARWSPTRKVSLAQGRFGRGVAHVQLRFVATAGTVRIDDVYVDPRFWR